MDRKGNLPLVRVAVLCTAAVACGGGALGPPTSDGGADSTSRDDGGGSSSMDSASSDDSRGSGSTSSSGAAGDSGDDGAEGGSDGGSGSSGGSIPCFADEAEGGGSDGGCSCLAADGGGDGGKLYQCVQTWVRQTVDCTTPHPPGYPGFEHLEDGGYWFSMTIDGDCVEVAGSFACRGTWSDGGFSCTITGTGGSPQGTCPGVEWGIWTNGDQPSGMPVPPGDLGVGTDGFSAVCQ